MQKDLYLQGKRIFLENCPSIGEGGEAEVYYIGKGLALKLFKDETHPEFERSAKKRLQAKKRILGLQDKLRDFPKDLPDKVLAPIDLVTDDTDRIVGFIMFMVKGAEPLESYSDPIFRQEENISNNTIMEIFRDLHQTVRQLHKAGVVIGDFNDCNVLVDGTTAYIADANSLQFGGYKCRMSKHPFVDPMLCEEKAGAMQMVKSHTRLSDWYGYNTALFKCLTYGDQYNGFFIPLSKANQIPEELRPLHRITVFHPRVERPAHNIPLDMLSEELHDYFYEVFEGDKREVFPLSLLDTQWKKCTICKREHANSVCLLCKQVGLPDDLIAALQQRRQNLEFRKNDN